MCVRIQDKEGNTHEIWGSTSTGGMLWQLGCQKFQFLGTDGNLDEKKIIRGYTPCDHSPRNIRGDLKVMAISGDGNSRLSSCSEAILQRERLPHGWTESE